MSDIQVGLEALEFTFTGRRQSLKSSPVLVGVVGSGNLEVLIEPVDGDQCFIHIETSARGFAAIWEAVATDFHHRHALGGVRVCINDMGATPAVVSLRLDQAAMELKS